MTEREKRRDLDDTDVASEPELPEDVAQVIDFPEEEGTSLSEVTAPPRRPALPSMMPSVITGPGGVAPVE